MQSAKDSTGRSVAAGAIGGVIAIMALAAIAALLLRCLGPRLMHGCMERMMSGDGCPEEMRACMEKCGCGRPAEAAEADRT
jgi:hypothetical protein